MPREIGYPVVGKVVSPRILHKSDVGGVVVGIADAGQLAEAFRRFQGLDGFVGMIVEERVTGVELILGAKVDFQFGPMVLLGMGGTGVEIYKDVSLKMAPINEKDALAMIGGLKAQRLLTGYRGKERVDLKMLTGTLLSFSSLVMELGEGIESIDINPLLCSPRSLCGRGRPYHPSEGRRTGSGIKKAPCFFPLSSSRLSSTMSLSRVVRP